MPDQMPMTAAPETSRPDLRAAHDAARVVFSTPDGEAATALWSAAQQLLQQTIGRPELTGQALVSEVRRVGRITLTDAHALVALATWADRATGAASNEAERLIVREAWMALDHAASNAMAIGAPNSARVTASVAAPAGTPVSTPRPQQSWAPPPPPPPPASPPLSGAAAVSHNSADDSAPVSSTHRKRLYLGLGAIALLLMGLVGGVWWYTGRAGRALDRGIEAYQRGSREAARVAFAEAATLDPNDARPLVYLGRISREDGDLARARRFLTTAVRVAPGSAIATRELASLMLADGQPEIARRFYVRAIEIDPTDRSAQGFLGCALVRLQRFEEAQRWIQRAGPGDWQRCMPVMPMLPPPVR